MKKKFRSFNEARKFAHSLKLNGAQEWEEFSKSKKRPFDIPSSPRRIYKKEWKDWGDFLGTGRTQNQRKLFRSFSKAREFARSLKLRTIADWGRFAKTNKRPRDIPSDASSVYKREWTNWSDFLGTDPKRGKNRKFWPFEKARKFVQSLNLKNRDEWISYYKSNERPIELPANPPRHYKKEWKGWGDWLYNKTRYNFWSFEKARKFARSLGLDTENQWRVYCKSGEKPDYIPQGPARVYKDEWYSMGDWLGTYYVAPQKRQYRSFKKARKFAQSLNFKNRDEWIVFCKSDKKPDDIPSNPVNSYKKEWKGMGDWLGTGNVATKEFWTFEKARAYVRKLGLKNNDEWVVFRKSNRRPDYIPASPQRTYKEFVSVGDWLGTGVIGGLEITRNYLPFEEAQPIYQKLAKQYDLNGRADWNRFAKTHKKLLDDLRLPAEPWRAYTKQAVVKYGKVRRERRK